MNIKAVHLVGDGLPGMSTKCFTTTKGDELVYNAGIVYVTTGTAQARRFFAFPMQGVRLELHELPALDMKAAKR